MAITQSTDLIRNHPVIGEVEFGIGEGKIPQSAHVAYFWETEKEFADGVRFLEAGLRGLDHCVIFGHEEANQAVYRGPRRAAVGDIKCATRRRLSVRIASW